MKNQVTIESITGIISYFKKVLRERSLKKWSCINYDNALNHLTLFSNYEEIPFGRLTKEWFDKFRFYLASAQGLRSEKRLSHNSANTYFRIVLSVARNAADERLIDHRILRGFQIPSRKSSIASSLTLDELQKLARTPYRVPVLKNAFLFCCLTGLQWKEISILKWENIQFIDGFWVVNFDQKLMPLNEQARCLLGNRGKPIDVVFNLRYSAALCVNLNQWALNAGILRNITFHMARQTFGKMLLDKEVPIELVSELLGHKQVKTTQKLFGIGSGSGSVETTSSYLRAFSI